MSNIETNTNIEKWTGKPMVRNYDVSKFITKDDSKERIYQIPNELKIDYMGNRKVLLSKYKEVVIKQTNGDSFHELICTKFS